MAGLLLGIVLGTVVSGAAGNIWGRRSVAAFAAADRGWLVAAAGLTVLGYAAAGQAVRGMAPHLITRRDAGLLPYAGAAANRVLPAGTGGAAVTTRVLTRRGADLPSAVGIVVAAAVGTAIAGAALLTVAALLLATGAVRLSGIRLTLPHTPLAVIVAVVLIGLLAAAALALRWRRRSGRPARMIQWIHQATTHRPTGQMLARFVAFAVISRVTCIGVLVASTTAVGYPIDVGPAIVILVAAGVAGSLIPVAGGAGSVEVALAVALHAAGLPFAAATAAALLSRIIGYWAPALAGLPALGLLAATQPAGHTETVARHQRPLAPIRPPAPQPRRTVAPVGGVALGAALACATTAAVGIWG